MYQGTGLPTKKETSKTDCTEVRKYDCTEFLLYVELIFMIP